MKTLLHLMAKDLRALRVQVLLLWSCLALATPLPCLNDMGLFQNDLTTPTVGFLGVMDGILELFAAMTMLSLLLGWMHLDHPQMPGGMMATRPVSGVRQWLSKVLLWLLAAALPAVVAVLLRLALLKLDLHAEDYFRVAVQTSLLVLAIFGPVALAAALVTHPKAAVAAGCLIMLTVGLFYNFNSFTHADLFLLNPSWVRMMDLHESRHLVGTSLLLASGFILAGWMLDRSGRRLFVGGLLALFGLSGLAWMTWPFPLMSRTQPATVVETGKVEQLQKTTGVLAGGLLQRVKRRDFKPLYRTSHLSLIQQSSGPALEWPKTMGYWVSYQPDNAPAVTSVWDRCSPSKADLGSSIWNSQSITRQSIQGPDIPATTLFHLLGLPQTLAPAFLLRQGDHSPNEREVAAMLSTPAALGENAEVHLSGEITCLWFRPSIIAELPLQSGATFTRNGRRVRIRSAVAQANQVTLRLSITRHDPKGFARNQPFDTDPSCLLYVANRKQGQIGLPRSARTSTTTSAFGETALIDAEAIYQVSGTSGAASHLNEPWLKEARLYIVEKQIIGSTQQPFEGEFTVHN